MTPIRTLTLAAAMALTIPTCVSAQTEDKATFDLKIRGLRAGYFSLSAAQKGRSYIASGVLKSAGLASLLRDFSYTARAQGTVTRGRYRPTGYAETASGGKKSLQRTIAYSGGKPVSVKTVPVREPKPYDVAPATMSGSVDPMTALYAVLRDVDAGQECSVDVVLYDGTESARISLSKPTPQDEAVICAGEYRRLAGFSPKELAEKTRFPFRLTYMPTDGGRRRVTQIALDTLYGTATMVRR